MKTNAAKPPARRAPRKEPPLDEQEVLFCHLVMKGTGEAKTTNLERIEAAGAKMGWGKAESSRIYHRKPVQAYLEKYRAKLMDQMVREEVRILKRSGYTREDVLELLHSLATVPPEKTRGSISGQVAAAEAMGKIMGLVVAPRNPDEFFKGRSEEEIAHFAEHGSFAPPRVM